MKKFLFIVAFFSFSILIHAQYGSRGVYSTTGNSTLVVEKDESRNVVGGTVIIPKFQGSGFNPTIKNAFQHACRIWEEKIPTTYPLSIEVRMAPLIGTGTLAMVETTYLHNSEGKDIEQAFAKRRTQIGWEGYYNYYVNRVDAIITFNSNQPFDYNEDPNNVSANKYDFITVAIQAIAKALGFYMTAFYDGINLVKLEPASALTEYVFDGYTSLSYQNIINNGGLSINYYNESWPLFCPNTYDLKYSLNYFAQDSSDLETIFMQPDIVKGKAIRYIGDSVNDVFNVFHWKEGNIATGPASCQVHSANTNDVIPYVGNNRLLANFSQSNPRLTNEDNTEDSLTWMASRREDQGPGLYVLLKDGTWETYQTLSNLNPANQDYARTADGYLRLMYITSAYDYLYHRTYDIIWHELYKFPPQIPEFGLNSYSESEMTNLGNGMRNNRRSFSYNTLEEVDYIDVVIGFEKTEGCKYVLVEQTDSDWPIPYTYYVDPSSGAFTAYMTRQYPSTIKLTYINDEGQAVSQPQIFDFTSDVCSAPYNISITQEGEQLHYEFEFENSSNLSQDPSYIINRVSDGDICKQGRIEQLSGYINISNLSKGLYNIVIHFGNKTISKKWIKK